MGHVDDIVAIRRTGQHSHHKFLEWWVNNLKQLLFK